MRLIMAAKINNQADEKPLETQDLNLQFLDDNLKLPILRKRTNSTSIIISPSPKKKKKDGQNLIPPKKFLLGGSIFDPLNLNSLQNEDVSKAVNKTPKSSPLRSNTVNIKRDQVNVIIPRNLADPLELITCTKNTVIDSLDLDTVRQKPPKKLVTKSLSDSGLLAENGGVINHDVNNEKEQEDLSVCLNKNSTIESSISYVSNSSKITCVVFEILENILDKLENDDSTHSLLSSNISTPSPAVEDIVEKIIELRAQKIPPKSLENNFELSKEAQVTLGKIKSESDAEKSQGVPQFSLSENLSKPQQTVVSAKLGAKPKQKFCKNEPKFKEKNAYFKYGNYNRYYGYRNPDDEDHRLKVLAERMDLFYGKDVLDIGCNIGHVTLSVARDFGAKSIVGMDIDRKLINIARKNVQYYISDEVQMALHNVDPNYQFNNYTSNNRNNSNCDATQSFPASMPMLYGPINLPGMTLSGQFPYNVSFVQGNYVLESDDMLSMETSKFDVILCLSITKWLHLNWGDDGLKRAFKRMYAQLRPGGMLVVEPQPWKSYGRRKTLTETIWRNYKTIQLKPPMFTEYLLKEVGFCNCETLAMPHNPSKGFQRPLKLYRKSNALVIRNVPQCTIVRPNETSNV